MPKIFSDKTQPWDSKFQLSKRLGSALDSRKQEGLRFKPSEFGKVSETWLKVPSHGIRHRICVVWEIMLSVKWKSLMLMVIMMTMI